VKHVDDTWHQIIIRTSPQTAWSTCALTSESAPNSQRNTLSNLSRIVVVVVLLLCVLFRCVHPSPLLFLLWRALHLSVCCCCHSFWLTLAACTEGCGEFHIRPPTLWVRLNQRKRCSRSRGCGTRIGSASGEKKNN